MRDGVKENQWTKGSGQIEMEERKEIEAERRRQDVVFKNEMK